MSERAEKLRGRVTGIAYVRYQAPDLNEMERFLLDFGLVTAVRSKSALYMRGTGDAHHIHITHLGATACGLGIGLRVETLEDLNDIALRAGATVEASDEPGGGNRVILTDPNGFRVDILHGQTKVTPLAVRSPLLFNNGVSNARLGATQRPQRGPSHITRLEHAVLGGSNFHAALSFYRDLLGFEISDTIYAGSPDETIVAFLHVGTGATHTDHHSVALIKSPESAIDHSAFVTLDWDDLMLGHEHLKAAGHFHDWGVGRHILGSEVFDYWRDPFGNKIEHCFDGDLVNDQYLPGNVSIDDDILSIWSPLLSSTFHMTNTRS